MIITILTSRRKGNGGQTAISTFDESTDAVSSASSVASATADIRSVFIFQFPATRGILPASIETSPLLEKDACLIGANALPTDNTVMATTEKVEKAVIVVYLDAKLMQISMLIWFDFHLVTCESCEASSQVWFCVATTLLLLLVPKTKNPKLVKRTPRKKPKLVCGVWWDTAGVTPGITDDGITIW